MSVSRQPGETLTVDQHLGRLDAEGTDYTVTFSFDPEGLEITVPGEPSVFYPENQA